MRRFWSSPYLLLSLTCLFWAGNSVIGRALRDDVPPVTLAFWRWSLAFCVLLPWVARPLARHWRTLLANWTHALSSRRPGSSFQRERDARLARA